MSIRYWLEEEFGNILEASGDYRVNCPFCYKNDRGHHLYVSKNKPIVHCFRCNWSGTYLQLIKECAGTESILEAKQLLKQPSSKIRDFVTVAERLAKNKKKSELLKIEELPAWFVPFNAVQELNKFHRNILEYALRRFTVGNIIKYNIGYCTDSTNEAFSRIVLPVEKGYYQARTIGKSKPKYSNPKIPVNARLFNYRALSDYPHVFICEGIISATAIGENAVATLGNQGATKEQKERLMYSDVKLFTIAYDAGEETSEAVLNLADYLSSNGKDVTIRKYAEGDPDSSNLYTEEEYSPQYKVFGMFTNFRRKDLLLPTS